MLSSQDEHHLLWRCRQPGGSFDVAPGQTVHGKVDVGEVVDGGADPGGGKVADVTVHKYVQAFAAPIPPSHLGLGMGTEPFRCDRLLRRKPGVGGPAGGAGKRVALIKTREVHRVDARVRIIGTGRVTV